MDVLLLHIVWKVNRRGVHEATFLLRATATSGTAHGVVFSDFAKIVRCLIG